MKQTEIPIRRRRQINFVTAGIVLFACLVVWPFYREIRQERMDADLIVAIREKSDARLTGLLAQGADPSARERAVVDPSLGQRLERLGRRLVGRVGTEDQGSSALALAVSQDDMIATRALLERGARDVNAWTTGPDASDPSLQSPLLLVAAYNGNLEIVRALLNRGATLDVRNSGGQTALMEGIAGPAERDNIPDAALEPPERERYRAVVQLLLERGVSVEIEDNDGDTALTYAARARQRAIVAGQQVRNADPNHVDQHGGGTPFHAAVSADDIPIVKAMLAKGARVNSSADEPPLLTALKPGGDDPLWPDPALVRLLLDRGADIHARKRIRAFGHESDLPCLFAAADQIVSARQHETLQLLLAHGVNIEERDWFHRTVLMVTAEKGSITVARFLLDHGARMEARDSGGYTPLNYAVQGKNSVMVRFLLERGANINTRDAVGHTPLDSALAMRDPNVIALLKQHGAKATPLPRSHRSLGQR